VELERAADAGVAHRVDDAGDVAVQRRRPPVTGEEAHRCAHHPVVVERGRHVAARVREGGEYLDVHEWSIHAPHVLHECGVVEELLWRRDRADLEGRCRHDGL
jgi:hypothetical protein